MTGIHYTRLSVSDTHCERQKRQELKMRGGGKMSHREDSLADFHWGITTQVSWGEKRIQIQFSQSCLEDAIHLDWEKSVVSRIRKRRGRDISLLSSWDDDSWQRHYYYTSPPPQIATLWRENSIDLQNLPILLEIDKLDMVSIWEEVLTFDNGYIVAPQV